MPVRAITLYSKIGAHSLLASETGPDQTAYSLAIALGDRTQPLLHSLAAVWNCLRKIIRAYSDSRVLLRNRHVLSNSAITAHLTGTESTQADREGTSMMCSSLCCSMYILEPYLAYSTDERHVHLGH